MVCGLAFVFFSFAVRTRTTTISKMHLRRKTFCEKKKTTDRHLGEQVNICQQRSHQYNIAAAAAARCKHSFLLSNEFCCCLNSDFLMSHPKTTERPDFRECWWWGWVQSTGTILSMAGISVVKSVAHPGFSIAPDSLLLPRAIMVYIQRKAAYIDRIRLTNQWHINLWYAQAHACKKPFLVCIPFKIHANVSFHREREREKKNN